MRLKTAQFADRSTILMGSVFACFSLVCFSGVFAADESATVTAQNLSASYHGSNSIKTGSETTISPIAFCEMLAAQFRPPRNGPFGAAPFKKLDCSGGGNPDSSGSKWTLSIDTSGEGTRVSLMYNATSKDKPVESAFVEVPSGLFITDKVVRAALAELFDQSPIFASVPGDLLDNKGRPTTVPLRCDAASGSSPPSQVLAYRLSRSKSSGLWRSEIIGSGTLGKSNGCPVWIIKLSNSKGLKGQQIFIHNKNGAGLGHYFDEFGVKNDAGLLSAYVGIRYAHPLLKDTQSGLMTKAKIFSLLAEFRGGLMRGLRVYVDYMPTTAGSVPETGENTSLSFQRYVLGYSLGYTTKKFPLRFEAVPKLGMWTLRSKLPLYSTDGSAPLVLPFDLVNQPSVSADLGIEYDLLHTFVARGWFSTGLGIAVTQAKNRTLVTSQRMGADLFWSPVKKGDKSRVTASLLASLFTESTTLKRIDTPTDPNEAYIGEFGFIQNYLAGGIALAW